ncbi:MAG: hypothetical protein WCW87_04305 [Candidatus Paceibacterota bacterium]
MNQDLSNILKLVEEKKFLEAKTELEKVLNTDLTSEEKGDLYIQFASLYMEVMNAINDKYSTALRKVVKSLKDVDREEKVLDERLNLEKVRSELKN